eukprot:CCRYP_018616-RA/>CCRYP_018616-RA protein AED:0.05 eAED:0.05 QI:215/0.5/0.33/1/1/1/3/0/517
MLLNSALSIVAVTSIASALSLHPLKTQRHRTHAGIRSCSSTALYLEDRKDGLSDYGRQRSQSELDSLQLKRDQMKKASLANIKPDDDTPRAEDIESMTKEEFDEFVATLGADDIMDNVNKMLEGDWSGAKFKTKRVSSTQEKRPAATTDGEDGEENFVYVDWTDETWDENELHIPNRIGFTTIDWGDEKKGFVNGKLKKQDRKEGKFNKSDLKKAYTKLQKSGITFVETSESFVKSESIFSKVTEDIKLEEGPLVASTFPNPWKHALRTRSRPRTGAAAISPAAEKSCERLGISSMSLYQVQNPWYYLGGTSALAQGMLEVIQDDHSRYVGCVDMSVSKLFKLQKILKASDEFVATNQFEFSLTNRQNMGMIQACKKLGITPICRNVLDGGLASGRYTSTNPTGGEVSKGEGDTGPYSLRQLEKLDALFKTLETLTETVSKRVKSDLLNFDAGQRPGINTAITTTQIAINYVRAKGAVPLVSVTNPRAANELLGCLGWDLNEEEVEELEKACKSCGV